eukprot:scaffold610868_cov142-Attheya_sp.AAC.2
MVFPSLDCSFGCISSVNVWWHELESYVVLFEGLFHFVGAFVVKYVEFWGMAVVTELLVNGLPSVGEVGGATGLEWG